LAFDQIVLEGRKTRRFTGEPQALFALLQKRMGIFQLLGTLFDAFLELSVETVELPGLAIQLDKYLDLGPQNLGHHGDRDVIHCARPVSLQQIIRFETNARNENNRGLLVPGMISDHGRELETVEVGHADIHEDDRNFGFQQRRQRFFRGRRLDQVCIDAIKDRLIREKLARLVVDQKDIDGVVRCHLGPHQRCSHMRNADNN
jgi:hypothetical protein